MPHYFCRHCRDLITFVTYNALRTHLRAHHSIYNIESSDQVLYRYDENDSVVQNRLYRQQQQQPPQRGEQQPRHGGRSQGEMVRVQPSQNVGLDARTFDKMMHVIGDAMSSGIERGIAAAVLAIQRAQPRQHEFIDASSTSTQQGVVVLEEIQLRGPIVAETVDVTPSEEGEFVESGSNPVNLPGQNTDEPNNEAPKEVAEQIASQSKFFVEK